MFTRPILRPKKQPVVGVLELIYVSTVRSIRKAYGNALYGLFMNIVQTLTFVLIFYFMFAVLGMRGSAIRGDFILYIMSGIFLFMSHIKALGAVAGSEGPASAMMKHAPMTTAIAIASAALGSLYMQVLSAFVILYGYHIAFTPVYVENWAGAFAMFLLAWFSGASIGMVFLALKPWFPDLVGTLSSVYSRANMIASGKMMVANSVPGYILIYFTWNPLFHSIDQARGFVFVNYNPHNSSITYPLVLSITLLMLGLMGEFFTRKHASVSWYSRR